MKKTLNLLVNQVSLKGAAYQNSSLSLTAKSFHKWSRWHVLVVAMRPVWCVHSQISDIHMCKMQNRLLFKVNSMANSNKSDCFGLVCMLYVSSQSLFLPVWQKSGDFTKITYFQWFTKRGKKIYRKKDVCNHVELTTKCVFWICLFVCFGRGDVRGVYL